MSSENDSTEHITAREFDNAIRALTNAMADGFHGVNTRVKEGMDGVHYRLDTLNSKVAKQEARLNVIQPRVAAHDVQLVGHDREFKDVKASIRGNVAAIVDGTTKAKPDDPATVSIAISPKMWALLGGVSAAFSLLIPTLLKLLEKWMGLS